MAWTERWRVPFESSAHTQYMVKIYEPDYAGDVVVLQGAGVPFVTMEADGGDVFEPVRAQTGYLSVVATDGELLEQLMPKTNTDKLVRLYDGAYVDGVWTDGSVKWQGFLCAQVFTQPWEGSTHVLQFPVQSLIGALDSVLIEKDLLTSSGRLVQLLTSGYTKLMRGETPYAKLTLYDDVVIDHSWLYTCVEWRVFFSNVESAHEGSVSVDRIGWSYLEALKEVCRLFGVVLRERGETLYVCRYGNDNYEIHGADYSWAKLTTLAGGGSVSVFERVRMGRETLLNLAEWKGTDNRVSYVPGANDARVALNLTADGNVILSLPQSPADTSEYDTVEVSDGRVYIQAHSPAGDAAYAFARYTLNHTYEVGDHDTTVGVEYMGTSRTNPTYENCLQSSMAKTPAFNPLSPDETAGEIVTGAFPVRWYHQPEGEGMELFKNGVLLNMQSEGKHRNKTLFKRTSSYNAILRLNGFGTYRFTAGYLHLSLGIEVFNRLYRSVKRWWEKADFGSYVKNQTYKLRLHLRVGNQYWNGSEWSPRIDYFSAEVKNGELVTNYTDDMPFSNNGGLYIPVNGGTLGDVEFWVWDVVEYTNFDDLHTYILTDLTLEFKPTYRLTVDDRSQNVYRKSIGTNGFKGDQRIELKIGTYNNNVPSAQFIIDGSGDYLEAFPYYLPTGNNSMERPERHLVNRLAGYYKEVRRVFKGIVGAGLPLCDKVYDYAGRVYMGVGSRMNWRDDVEEVTWMELEDPETMAGEVTDTVVPAGSAPYTTTPDSWNDSGDEDDPTPAPSPEDRPVTYPVVTSDVTIGIVTLEPNTMTVFGVVEELYVQLNTEAEIEGYVNEYVMQFETYHVTPAVYFPPDVNFAEYPNLEPDRMYRVRIINNYATLESWSVL